MLLLKKRKSLMGNNLNSDKYDKKISFAIIFQLCILITNYTIKEVFSVYNPLTREFLSLGFMLLVGIFFFKNLPYVMKRIGNLFIITYAVCIIIFLVNILLFNQNLKYIIEISFWFFLICIPTGLYYIAIKNKAIFLNMLIKSAYYQIIVGLIFMTSSYFKEPSYDMVFSYLILVPIIILTYKVFNEFSILDVILIVAGLVSILIIGSRGPFLSLIVFFVILLGVYLFENRKKMRSLLALFFIWVSLIVFLIFFDTLLLKIERILSDFGIQSRTLFLFTSENVDFLTGRSDIYTITLQKIVENPLLGYGLAGDRLFLNGTYPHNIFLEVLSQFGIILGSLMLFSFLFYWMNGLLNQNKVERDIFIIFFGIGLVQLFVSGSYLTSSNFWLFMAVCITSVHLKVPKG